MNFKESLNKEFKDGIVKDYEDYSFAREDKLINKIAAMDIYNPNEENVNKMILNYAKQETSFFPKALNFNIKFIPSNVSASSNGVVEVIDGQGTVEIKLYDNSIYLPFLIRESSLIPFDVIQGPNDTVTYSRENLAKVLMYIDRENYKKDNGEINSGFEAVVDVQTDETDNGFLGDTLKIRDSAQIRRGTNPGELLVKMGSELLDRVEKITPATPAKYEKLAAVFTEKFSKQFVEEITKLAEENTEELDKHVERVFDNLKDLEYKDVHSMANGTFIEFPERDKNTITNVRAIVLKNLKSLPKRKSKIGSNIASENGSRPQSQIAKTLIVTTDGRYKLLEKSSPFFAIKKEQGNWDMKLISFKDVKQEETVAIINQNDVYQPVTINTKINREDFQKRLIGYNEKTNKEEVKLNIDVLDYLPIIINSNCLRSVNGISGQESFVYIKDDSDELNLKKVNVEEYKTIIKEKRHFSSLKDSDIDLLLYSVPCEFTLINDKTKAIHLRDDIKSYLTKPDEYKFAATEEAFDELWKTASTSANKVTLRLRNEKEKLFDVEMQWRDDTKAMSFGKKKFENVGEGQVKGILRTAGIDYSAILALIYKAKIDRFAEAPLPEGATPGNVNGGQIPSLVSRAMAKVKENIYNKQTAELTASELLGQQLGGLATELPMIGNVVETLRSYASESEALASKFEKIAMDNKNDDFLSIAKLMLSQSKLEKIAYDTIKKKGNQEQMFYKEACEYIKENKDTLENLCEDLMILKVAQIENKNEIVSPSIIGGAVKVLDRMYKTAVYSTR